jgi:hypothetical protein
MSSGLYTHRNRFAGEIVDASMYNGAHQNQIINDVPVEAGADSDTVTEFRQTTDPTTGDGVTAAPVVDVASELQQYRFVLEDIKTVLNGGAPPTYWYSTISPTAALVIAHGARVFRNAGSQAIPTKTFTPCIFDTVHYDTGVIFPTFDPFFRAATPTRLTASKGGIYEINGFVEWNSGATSGDLAVLIRLNGTKIIGAVEQAADGQSKLRWQQTSCQYQLAQGDYVELVVFQTMGGPTFNLLAAEFGLELMNLSGVVTPPVLETLTVTTAGTGTGVVAWTPTNDGSVSPELFVQGTVVSLTPAMGLNSAFAGWSGDVPVGHEHDNPLVITMNTNKNIVATFNLVQANGALFVGVQAGGFAPATPFLPLTQESNPYAAVASAQVQSPNAMTINSMYVVLTGAPGLTKSVTFRLNVNGVGNNNITVTISGVSTTGHATGLITINQDDLVCLEATNFTGGLASITIDHVAIGYVSVL